MPLSHAASLHEVLPQVQRPGRLLRVVLYNLEACHDANRSAYVRMGVSGNGCAPSHLVVFDGADGQERVFGRFDNASGDWADLKLDARNWSTTRTSLAEVEQLLDGMFRRERLAA